MINITRKQLLQLATTYLLANTPRSLFDGLMSTEAVKSLRLDADINALMEYYDVLTSRAKRTEVIVGLAYGILVAVLMHKDNLTSESAPDVSRLQWGEEIRQIAASATSTVQVLDLGAASAKVRTDTSPGSAVIRPVGTGHNWKNG